MQDNHFDVMTIVTGAKGFGKSTAAIYLSIKYIQKFGFVCPDCGAEFYKNVYAIDGSTSPPRFYIPDFVKDGKAVIECPIQYKLNLKTGERKQISGCASRFTWGERKQIKWEAQKFIAYDNQDVFDKIFSLPDFSPIIADEAMKFSAGQLHNKAESKALKELLTMVRPKRFLFFLCIPEFGWLDSKYREGLSSFWLRMIERGAGVLIEKDKGEAKEKYHVKDMEEIMGVIKFFTPMEKIRHKLKKHKCYFDMFRFPALPQRIYDNYEMVRNAVNLQRQVEERQLSNKDLAKVLSWNILNKWDKLRVLVDRCNNQKPTYSLLSNEFLSDPITKQPLASDATIRNWVQGVNSYVKSGGKNIHTFEGEMGVDTEKLPSQSDLSKRVRV